VHAGAATRQRRLKDSPRADAKDSTVSFRFSRGSTRFVASKLRRFNEIASGTPEIDVEKVRAIKESVARGSYRVDAERIADKLIRMDTALHRARRRGRD